MNEEKLWHEINDLKESDLASIANILYADIADETFDPIIKDHPVITLVQNMKDKVRTNEIKKIKDDLKKLGLFMMITKGNS